MKSIVLPAGTMHVRFGDLPEMITGALHPDAGTDSSAIKYVAARNEVLRALRREVDAGDLPVFSPLNPMVPHEFPIGDALNRALVTVADLRQFIAPTGLTVRVDAPEPTAPPVVAIGALGEPAKAEPVDKGWIMKKAALIDKHAKSWPTVKRDFQDASENGLSKAAKAPLHGGWYENAALNWAEQRGKRTSEKQQGPANSIFNIAGKKHTTED